MATDTIPGGYATHGDWIDDKLMNEAENNYISSMMRASVKARAGASRLRRSALRGRRVWTDVELTRVLIAYPRRALLNQRADYEYVFDESDELPF